MLRGVGETRSEHRVLVCGRAITRKKCATIPHNSSRLQNKLKVANCSALDSRVDPGGGLHR